MWKKRQAQLINKYFTYTNREKNGILVLVVLLMFLQIALFILHFIPDPHPLEMDQEMQQNILRLVKKYKVENTQNERAFCRIKSSSSAPKMPMKELAPVFEYFDPNDCTIKNWELMGLTEKQALSIIHWREKGGCFNTTEDVRKMFVISTANFKRMEPFIRILQRKPPEAVINKEISTGDKYPKSSHLQNIVDINTADSTELMKLPMIGEGRARSIIKYRTMLGGFVNLEQLKEVRNLPDSVIQLIGPMIKVNPQAIKQLDINAEVADSLNHPYLPKSLARMIVLYRKEHGNFQEVRDLLKLPLFNDEILRKLAPYLTLKQ